MLNLLDAVDAPAGRLAAPEEKRASEIEDRAAVRASDRDRHHRIMTFRNDPCC